MAQQIKFFRKNIIDLENTINMTVTDSVALNNGQDFLSFVRNRKNTSAWMTTGSTNAANTQIDIDFRSPYEIDTIMILLHNLRSYTVQYFNGSIYVNFSTPISVTNGTADNSIFTFTSVITNKIRIIITDVNGSTDDKKITQIIITKSLGQLAGWPVISKPTVSRNKKINKMISGKAQVVDTIETVRFDLNVEILSLDADLTLLENLYDKIEGFLVWINAGDEAQFSSVRKLYRFEDIYLMRPIDDWTPEFYRGVYTAGMKISVSLQEAVY